MKRIEVLNQDKVMLKKIKSKNVYKQNPQSVFEFAYSAKIEFIFQAQNAHIWMRIYTEISLTLSDTHTHTQQCACGQTDKNFSGSEHPHK